MTLTPPLKIRTKRGISRLAQAVGSRVTTPGARCLVYHAIVEEAQHDPAQMTTPLALFKAQMAFLADHGYRVEDAASVVERLKRGERLDPKTVALTFDDGFADAYHLALPILRTFRFPATVFLIAEALDGNRHRLRNGYPGAYLNRTQVRELAASRLVQFGCHSATHQTLRRLPAPVLRQEIEEAKHRLEDVLGEAMTLFAYPFGSFGAWDRAVREAVQRAGFRGAFTSVAGLNTVSTDGFLLRRSRVSWCDTIPEFDRLLQGAYDWYAVVQRLQAPITMDGSGRSEARSVSVSVPKDGSVASRERLRRRLSRRFAVERMTLEKLDELRAFFKRAYADQPVAAAFQDSAQILKRWRWLNEENPVPFDGGLPAWICLKDGRIVGHFAALPAIAVAQGEAIPVCWGRDLIVAPEARQHGVGPLLITTAVAAAERPFLIAGLNDAVYPMYRRLGFFDGGTVPLHLKVYQPKRLLDTLAWPRPLRWVAAAGVTAARRFTPPRRPDRLSIVPLERFDERFDQWWAGVEQAFACVIRRTSATMAWRYRQHPSHHYATLAAMDGQALRGVAVVRHGRSRGLPAGFISELLAAPDDREAIEALLNHAIERLVSTADEPLVFIRCAVLHRAVEQALRRAGFLNVPSPIHWMLAQAEGSSKPIPLPLLRRDAWLLNAGDADLDAL